MKFARLSSLLHEISRLGSRNVFHSNFSSMKEMPSRRFIRPWEGPLEELYRRISPVGNWNTSIAPILDQWVEEGRSVDRKSLIGLIRELRSYRRFGHALEVSMWMTDKRYYHLNSSDVAVRLDLISKAQGTEHAERYFNNIPQKLKDVKVYGALLSVYATAQRVQKAEAVMQEMRDLGFASGGLVYNLMLVLYYKTGNMEKFEGLLKEMEDKGIVHDKFTPGIQLSAYAAVMDIEGMDRVVTLMESDPKVVFDWTNCTVAAAGYTKAGLLDKALEMLKKAEARVSTKGNVAYNHLITQYATIGRKDEVLRVWSLYKKKYKVYNRGYECILSSLVKLGGLEIAQKNFYEWESQDLSYDIRIPNIMIGAYCTKGLFEKAEALVDRAISKGAQPNAWTWYSFATGYFQSGQPEKAVEMMKQAIVRSAPLWRPSNKYFAACLEYLKGVGKMEEAEEFIKMMLDKNIISLDIQEKLSNTIKESVQNGALLELMEPEEK